MAITYLSGKRVQGSSTGTGSFTPSGSFNVRYLVGGGGGGAVTNNGGGSGAGGFRTDSSYGVTAQTYSIIVGEKGVGQTDTSGLAQNGGDSTFGSITANGGGAGGGSDSSGNTIGQDGGSGGAGGDRGTKEGGAGNTPSTSPAQGYDGGNGGSYGSAGGGGGGAYEAGNDADGAGAGDGGAGIDSDITGSTINYCAGGGGATQNGHVGLGGNSDAGDGYGTGDGVGQNATTTAVGTSAGNGGGGGRGGAYKGGDGSDGIIILRFTTSGNSYSVVGGDVDTDGSDTVITFTVGNASGIDEKTTVTDVPVGSQFEETDTRKFYQLGTAYLGNTDHDDVAHFESSNELNKIIGEKITVGNPLIGKTITSIGLKLYRMGSGTATGLLSFGIWDFATGDLKGTAFGTIQADTIVVGSAFGDAVEYTKVHSGSGVELAVNDIIGIRCDYTDASASADAIEVAQHDDATPDTYPYGARCLFTQGADSPASVADKDIWFKAHFKDWVERGTAI